MLRPLQSKLVGERITVHFNFLDVLSIPETIATHDVEVWVAVGDDAEPELLLFGAGEHTAEPGEVSHQIHQGIPGVIYWLMCTITTDQGRTYMKKSALAILPSPGLVPDLYMTVLTTKIYPIEHRVNLRARHEALIGKIREMPFPKEYIAVALGFIDGQLAAGLKSFSTRESFKAELDFENGTLEVKLVTCATSESAQFVMAPASGTIRTIVIQYTPRPESWRVALGFVSGTLT